MKIAYIAHPVGGHEIKENLERIRLIVREINLHEPDVIPFAPYWLDCHALSDEVHKERMRGIRNNAEYFRRGMIDEMRLYGSRISSGMVGEIVTAIENKIPVRAMTKDTKKALVAFMEGYEEMFGKD